MLDRAALAEVADDAGPSGPSRAEAAAFRARGHLAMKAALPAETIAAAAPALRAFIHERQGVPDPFGDDSRARSIFTLLDAPAPVARFVTSPRLGEIAADLLDVDAVRLWNFRGFFKPAGGGGTPWHQDQTYIPLDTYAVVTLWAPLAEVEADMGALLFAEGSHAAGPIHPAPEVPSWPVVRDPPLGRGDLSAHLGWTLHASLPNVGGRTREAVAVCFYADGARLKAPPSPFLAQILRPMLTGVSPGEPVAGAANPLVFKRSARP